MSTPELEDALIGRILGGKFRLRKNVGAGASGSVYQADQTALGRTVAVKILNPALAEDPRLVKRFHDEALAASRLNHPNTVSVIDYGQSDDGLLYIVMEYLRGTTLTQLILDQSPCETERVVDILTQILAGLEEAHHCGVIHADLKSDNIVVEHRRGDWDLVKVVDFGIARLLEKPRDEDSKRTICGTPEYMAPEIISGSEPTVATDLYAVGVILYEMLAGVTPFAGGETLAVLTSHLRDQPRPPSERSPHPVNPVLERIALKALSKPPTDRYLSAAEFRDALDEALEEEPSVGRSTVKCSSCGVSISGKFKFCPECGFPLLDVGDAANLFQTSPDGKFDPAMFEFSSTIPGADSLVREEEHQELWPLPLMGREETIERILRFVEGPGTGVLQVVGVSGSGRTRLLTDIERRTLELSDTRVYRVEPDPTGLDACFHPIRQLVSSLLGLSDESLYDDLSHVLESVGLSRRDVPGIAELFGHHSELWQLEPDVRRREIFAAVARVLGSAARGCRVVVLFENVDRYDVPSKNLVRHLVERGGEHTLRMIVSMCPESTKDWPIDAERLDIDPLDGDDLLALDVYLEDAEIPNLPSASQMIQLTGGHPAHVDQVVRYAAEGQTLENLPSNLADLISERIKLLPHPARVVCQAAAVFGDSMARNTLFKVMRDRLDTPFDAALAVLVHRGIMTEARDTGVIGFSSRLVRDIVYDATPAELRRELHAAAVQVLEASGALPLVLGHHHDLAGHVAQACALLGNAADDAVRQMDESGATQLYHRALDAARKLMLSDAEGESRGRFVTLSVKLAESLRVTDRAALARGVVEEAKNFSDGNPALDAQLLQASAHLFMCENKIDAAVETLQRGIGLLIPVGNTELLAEMYLDLSSLHLQHGDHDTAIAELGEGLDIVTLGEGKAAVTGPTMLWHLLLRLGQMHATRGDHEEALDLCESALIHARRVRSRIGSARVQATLASLYEEAGNASMAEQYRAAAVNEMRRLGDRRGTAELLLAGVSPTLSLVRVDPEELREAHRLALEVGWREGVEIAKRKTMDLGNM